MATNAERAALLIKSMGASVTGDSSIVAQLCTDDVHGWSPTFSVSSAVELAVEFEDLDEAFSDIELEVRPLDVGGDRACVEWVATLTHSGPLNGPDDLPIDPTGARARLHGVTVAEFDGSKIRSFRQYWDEAELLEQLALLPVD